MVDLAKQDWLGDRRLAKLFEVLENAGGEVRVAGGAVRNGLWGLPVSDIDVATTLLPDEVMAVAKKSGLGVHPTGIDHGTVTVVIDALVVEVTTLRADVKTDGRRAVVAFSRDWSVDAARRDFTFNALYCDLSGKVFDETGQGLADSATRRVRFVGDPEQRIGEDYLRILRYFRFEAQYGNGVLDDAALAACVNLQAGLTGLSAERIHSELFKILVAPGVVEVVETMVATGILQQVISVDHSVDRLAAIVALEDRLAGGGDALRRLAGLTSDISHLRLSNNMLNRFREMHQPVDLEIKNNLLLRRKFLYEIGRQTYRDRVLLAWAGTFASPDDAEWRKVYDLADEWPVPVFPVSGKDLIAAGFSPGKEMGEVLKRLERDWIAAEFLTGKDELLKSLQTEKK